MNYEEKSEQDVNTTENSDDKKDLGQSEENPEVTQTHPRV
jgi:hypothetical protein